MDLEEKKTMEERINRGMIKLLAARSQRQHTDEIIGVYNHSYDAFEPDGGLTADEIQQARMLAGLYAVYICGYVSALTGGGGSEGQAGPD